MLNATNSISLTATSTAVYAKDFGSGTDEKSVTLSAKSVSITSENGSAVGAGSNGSVALETEQATLSGTKALSVDVDGEFSFNSGTETSGTLSLQGNVEVLGEMKLANETIVELLSEGNLLPRSTR